ncbi:hypothetical protein C8R46DRAFT_1034102 [Mycena filopes]|nr:hypothetical protein C8R46DRAFT_1034102 [Mycena filopes]
MVARTCLWRAATRGDTCANNQHCKDPTSAHAQPSPPSEPLRTTMTGLPDPLVEGARYGCVHRASTRWQKKAGPLKNPPAARRSRCLSDGGDNDALERMRASVSSPQLRWRSIAKISVKRAGGRLPRQRRHSWRAQMAVIVRPDCARSHRFTENELGPRRALIACVAPMARLDWKEERGGSSGVWCFGRRRQVGHRRNVRSGDCAQPHSLAWTTSRAGTRDGEGLERNPAGVVVDPEGCVNKYHLYEATRGGGVHTVLGVLGASVGRLLAAAIRKSSIAGGAGNLYKATEDDGRAARRVDHAHALGGVEWASWAWKERRREMAHECRYFLVEKVVTEGERLVLRGRSRRDRQAYQRTAVPYTGRAKLHCGPRDVTDCQAPGHAFPSGRRSPPCHQLCYALTRVSAPSSTQIPAGSAAGALDPGIHWKSAEVRG